MFEHVGIDLGYDLLKWFHDLIKNYTIIFTLFAVITEIIIIIILFKPKLISKWAFSISFFHIVTFYVGGMFFYKWIILNLIIFISFFNEKRNIPFSLGSVMIFFIVIPILFAQVNLKSPFKNYWLYWWDTYQYSKVDIIANFKDGSSKIIPNNVFLYGSLGMVSYPVETFSKNHRIGAMFTAPKDYKYVEDSKNCDIEIIEQNLFLLKRNKLINFIKKHHFFLINRPKFFNSFWFNLYPHHVFSSFSNTINFIDNNNLNNIVSYTVELIIGCITEDFEKDEEIIYRDCYEIII